MVARTIHCPSLPLFNNLYEVCMSYNGVVLELEIYKSVAFKITSFSSFWIRVMEKKLFMLSSVYWESESQGRSFVCKRTGRDRGERLERRSQNSGIEHMETPRETADLGLVGSKNKIPFSCAHSKNTHPLVSPRKLPCSIPLVWSWNHGFWCYTVLSCCGQWWMRWSADPGLMWVWEDRGCP